MPKEVRIRFDPDELELILQLPEFSLDAPISGIYDEPVRWYKANLLWAKIIEGFVGNLAVYPVWSEIENESAAGAQGIMTFLEGVDVPIDDFNCDDVEDCLGVSQTIADIHAAIAGIESGGSQTGNPENVDKPIDEGASHESGNEPAFIPDTCDDDDKDKLWGAISDFVDYCHSINTDFFQTIQVYTSRAKLLSTVISAIPLFGLLPVDEGIEAAAWLADIAAAEYLAAVTTNGLMQVKCDLFCAAVAEGCQFDVNTAFSYFLDNDGITEVNSDSTFEDYIEQIGSGFSVSGNEVFCLMSAFQIAVASLGEKFGDAVGMKSYTKAAQAGALQPDAGWRAWCDECPVDDGDWTLILDFANDYVKADESETVYRNAFNLLRESTAFSTTGTAVLTQQYGGGLKYTATGSTQFKNKQLTVSNAAALFKTLSINARKVSGSATQWTIDTDSNTYNPTPRQFNSTSFSWSAPIGVANIAGTAGAVTRIALNFSQLSGFQAA